MKISQFLKRQKPEGDKETREEETQVDEGAAGRPAGAGMIEDSPPPELKTGGGEREGEGGFSPAWTFNQEKAEAFTQPRTNELAPREQGVIPPEMMSVAARSSGTLSAGLSFHRLSQQRPDVPPLTLRFLPPHEPAGPDLPVPQTESAETLFLTAYDCLTEIFARIQKGERVVISPAVAISRRLALMMQPSAPVREDDQQGADYLLLQKAVTSPCSAVNLAAHSLHVSLFAAKIGVGLKYSVAQLTELIMAAFFHDVGMLLVPGHILEKSEQLTAEEYAAIRQHPLIGHDLLKEVEEPWGWLAQVALQEQEREKGQGYPHGLTGDKIHPYAKIVGLADVFDALTHPRSYRKVLPPFEAVRMIIRLRAEEFSPPLIKVMVGQLSFFPARSWVQLNSGEIGRVDSINRQSLLRPVVSILYDSRKAALPSPKVVNLEKDEVLYIVKSLSDREVAELGEGAVLS